MLKGLAITPPVIGRISIGRVVERNGKRLPEKDDQFTLTTQVQGRDGWLLHPLDEKLRKEADGQKLRAIPVRLLFKDPNLNLRADYSLFDRATGRPVCVGNGETCRRTGKDGVATLPCPGPDACGDESARTGFANGAFEELEEDVPAVVEEFYPERGGELRAEGREPTGSGLKGRLEARVSAAGHCG